MQNAKRHSGIGMHLTGSNSFLSCNAGHIQIWPWGPCFGWLVPSVLPALGGARCSPLPHRPARSHFATRGCRPGRDWCIFVVIVPRGYTAPAWGPLGQTCFTPLDSRASQIPRNTRGDSLRRAWGARELRGTCRGQILDSSCTCKPTRGAGRSHCDL